MPALIIWSMPRSRSTALERAFIEHPSSTVTHETFTNPSGGTYNATDIESKLQDHIDMGSRNEFYVTKELTCYVPPSSPKFDELISKFNHVILMRNPRDAITSLKKCGLDGAGVTYFDINENGVLEALALKDKIHKRTNRMPLVVDADKNLMRDPAGTVSSICDYVGVQFCDSMMTWESKSVEQFKKLEGWHDDAERSTGIGKLKQHNQHTTESVSRDTRDAGSADDVKEDDTVEKKVPKYYNDDDVVSKSIELEAAYRAVLHPTRTTL
jgi:hypothetical protein